ncbi:hypothetical protein PUN28_018543 [Cardiocondyla obscurior]|uniref:Titin n=1 Tax=Cardiocondyla obscurior TaxID=286306 RepID=A0AAW2EEC4_9HYME
MTIHKKGTMSKTKNTGTAKNEVASTSSDVTTEAIEVVSSSSVVEESNRVKESESRSSLVEVTSGSREVIMDSKGNVIKVIETPPQTVQQSSSTRRSGKSSQDFIAGEQVQSIKQAKTTHETPRKHASTSLSESRAIHGDMTERVSHSVQSQSASQSIVQQSSSSSLSVESSSTSEDRSGRRFTAVSHDVKNGARVPAVQTSSRSTENTRASSETNEAVTKNGQTMSSTTRIRETGEKVDDNGRVTSTSSREVDSELTIAPSASKNTDDVKKIGDKSTRGDLKPERIETPTRCNKPGQSTWDGTFVYEKPTTPKGKTIVDKTASSKILGDSEASVKVTQVTSSTDVTDQIVSSNSSVTRNSKTIVDESKRSAAHFRSATSEKAAADTTDFANEEHPKGPARYSKPGDSAWDGRFVVEETAAQSKRRNDADVNVSHGRDGNIVETTQRSDFREKNADGTYKESSTSTRVVKGATDSTRFISEERHDASRESSIHVDGTPKEVSSVRVSSPQRKPGRPGEVVEKLRDDAKNPSDVTVVRRTEKRHDSVDVKDVTEEQNVSNVSESVSASYIVEYAITSDKKNVEKVTSVSEVILEEDGPEDKIARAPKTPERHGKVDTTSRCYKPGQSAWDGTFVYERPVTPDNRRRPEDKRAVKTIDIRDVTEDNSINEADVTNTSYIVEHSSSQQSFVDARDASMSTIYETVVYEGRPIETKIRFDDTSRSKVSADRRTSPSPRSRSPEKTPKDRDLRSVKPGSSTWDGTFVLEKSPETKRPSSRESTDSGPDKPTDSKKTPKKHISEITIDLRDVTRDVSGTSETAENSFVIERSKMHESYTDSSNVDFSTTSVETVVIRDGQPITTQKTVTIQESPRSPAKSLPSSDVITATDVKETTVKSHEKEFRADERSYRPLKPGTSARHESFAYEKPEDRKPGDKKPLKDNLGKADKRSSIKEKPSGQPVDHRTVTILDTSKGVTSTADYSTSSVTVERTYVADSETYDSSNVSKIFIRENTENKAEEPKPSPRQRPEDITEFKSHKSPDRSHRPSKPGASTWDGSFVYEKSDRKAPKGTPADKRSPFKEKPSDHKTSITILNTSKDISSFADSKTYDSSNISKIYITDSSLDKTYPINYEKPRQPSDKEPKPLPRQRPEDTKKPKDEKPQKSPVDRTHRPSKPGASTWDGSFVYEKPQDTRKKPTEPTETPKKPVDERKPIDKEKKPTAISLKPADGETTRNVTEIKYIEDVADITRADIARTSEVLQQSSYVIDQSSRFTSVQDVRDVKDERIIAEFTTDVRKDARDVTESTKKFIDKEQVTSMVARDVINDTRFDTVTGPTSRSPTDSTRKPSPERPGYPRGIPGLRDDDRQKPTPTAGKPSRPPQRERSPQRPTDHGRPSEIRPKSPEKSRDYTSPTRKPAAGKPSRPEERPSRKPDKDSGPAKHTEKRPHAEMPKSIRFEKPKSGDQSPDSLDEDVTNPKPMPVPDVLSKIPLKEQCICEICTCGRHRCPHNFPQEFEISYDESMHTVTSYRQDYDEKRVEKQTKYHHEDHLRTEGEFIGQRKTDYVATKGERAPVKKPQDHLKPEGEFARRPKEEAPTRGERAPVKKPQDNLRPEGEFVGKPREEAPKFGERAPITKPRDNLKFEGDFDTVTTTELVFTGTPGERPNPIRRNTYTKIEGDFIDETTTRSQYIDHRSIQRAEIIKRTDNLTVGEGEFTGTSHIKEDFQTHVVEREPQWRPKYPEDIDRFYSKTDIIDSTTTTQEQYRTFDQTDYKSTTVIKRADNLKPEGPFEALPHTKDDYVKPILMPRIEPQKPKDNLKPEGPFEGRPKDDFIPKRAERPEVKRPKDNLRPEGHFTDRPKSQYTPGEKRTPIKHPDNLHLEGDFERPETIPYGPGDRASVVRHPDNLFPIGEFPDREVEPFKPAERRTPIKHNDNLRPEGPFEGRPKNDYLPKRAERPEAKRPEDNLRPEGDFERPEKAPISPAERRTPIKHADNLKPEGEFERPRPEGFRPAEKPEVKKPVDNLRPEGEFERPRPGKYAPAEKRKPVKHPDNLKPEGEFIGKPKEDFTPTKGIRADVKKPEDNLKPEGPFEGRPKDDYRPVRGERVNVVKRTDNLRMEGDIETYRSRDEYTDFLIREKTEVTKYQDNLRMEGEFIDTRTRDDFKFVKGERMDVVKHRDNLKPEGPFEGRPKDDYSPKKAERPEIKKPEDNLKPEGEFVRRPKEEAPKRGERADVKKPRDNLRPEGDFERPEKKPIGPAERRTPIKHSDNLKPEGEFERPVLEEFKPAERPIAKKPFDNLKPEGEFVSRPKEEAPKKGERADVKKPKDNLKPEGDFERPEKKPIGPAERRTPIKHSDNLKPEGEFERPKPEEFRPAERPVAKKPHDNLKPEGEFISRPKEKAPKKGDRADVKKPKDNLRPEGDFERPEKTPVGPAERRTPIKHPDNLKPEGEFERPEQERYRPAERPEVKKPTDNLKPEGKFERPYPEKYVPAEKRTPVKHPDNLKPEGEFIARPKEDFTPTKGDRAEVKRPEDNLKPEGPFEARPKDDYRPVRGERMDVVKHTDNLRMEGDIETYRSRDEYTDFLIRERTEITKYQDNLRMEGEFIDTRTRDDFKVVKGERMDIVKHRDNLKPEGPFEGRPKDDYSPKKAERPEIKKPEDNLKPEGDFVRRPKEEAPKRGERADVKKPKDNLRPEGDFERPEKKPIGPAERRSPIKHSDNLKPEGEFERRKPEEFRPAERPVVKKPHDNLKPEGEFVSRPKEEAPRRGDRADIKKPQDNLRPEGDFERPEKKPIGPAERRSPIKHSDNLKPEGEFERRKPEEFRPAERPVVKKPHDNLKPEGEFVSRPKEEAPRKGDRADIKKPQDNLRPEGDFEIPEKKPIGPAERRSPIKHSDNLKPEGEFEKRKPEEFRPAERPVVKKPHDNLKPEGEFVSRPKEEAPRKGDRADIRKPQDNLRPEGDFERPERKPIGPAERRTPIKHADNLKPEGEFVRKPKEEAPKRGDRADVKKPADNLKPEGEFERPEKTLIRPAEKRVPIKHPDNLRPEGEFEKRPKEKAPKGERADVTKPKDNLRPEGEFERPEKSPIKPAERRTPIRHEDNLYPEGEFVGRPKDDFVPKRVDRPVQKKPKDNLKPEGEFVGKPKDDYKPVKGERTDIVVHRDNLKMEGDIDIYRSRDDYVTTSKRERVDIVHHEDNLKIEGEFVDIRRRDDYRATRGERSEIVRREDNLHPEGNFERPEKSPVGPAERRSPIKHPDNLKPEGDFAQRPKETAPTKGDRAPVKKPRDNLKPEGEFVRPAKSPVGPGERRSPIKHPDNLHPEGEFAGRPKKDTPLKGDRADVKKPKDNLYPEGEFAKRFPKKVEPAERRTPIKHEDNLRPEGEMEVSPKDDYKYVNGERVEVRRHEDHLRMEGQMDIHRSRDDYKIITRVEKVDVKRHEDNLRMEGEFVDVRRKDDYVHVVGERAPIKKHPDNLRPEGDFERPQKTVIGPAERRTPIKHPDNLKPEGDFVKRPRDDFTPKRAEKAEVVKREDNLKMTGGFEGTTSHKSTYTVVRGERADVKSHEDNLKISSGTMETKTTSRDSYTPSKYEPSPSKAINHRRHMESSISLGDDVTTMTTTNQRNYNTYTKRAGKDVASKISQMESDTRKIVESQNLADGTVVTTVKRTSTAAHSDQRHANVQTVTHNQQTQHVTDRRAAHSIDVSPSGPVDSRKTTSQLLSNQHHEQHQRTHASEQHLRSQNINHRQVVREEDTSRYAIDATHGELQRQHHVERHHQEMTKRDYVNAQHMESRQRSTTKQHEQHTISSQARYNSSSPEFRQSINGQTIVERSQIDSGARHSHHRKNVISSSSADVNNSVLHRRGATTSTEALHTISSTAADQRKSISNLAESGQYISNSTQSNDRRSFTSLYRNSKEVNPWASSSYERPQRIVRQDNLTVGGKFYSQSEAKSYGNFSQSSQKIERVQKQINASHINLGDGNTVSSSMYKREYVPRHRGPCPAALLEAKQAPFKHTRDTQKHKFYMPVVSN